MALQGHCLCQIGKSELGLELATKAHHLDPNAHLPHITVWTALSKLNRNAKYREEILRKALHLNPNDAQTWGLLGLEYIAQSRSKEALEAALRGLEIDPEEKSCLDCQSLALFEEGRFGQALSKIHQNLAIRPDDALNHGFRAMGLFARGETQKAEESLRQGLALEPDCAMNQYLWRMTTGPIGVLFRLIVRLRWGPGLWLFGLLPLFLYLRSITPEYPTFSQLPLTYAYSLVELGLVASFLVAPCFVVFSSVSMMKRGAFIWTNLVAGAVFIASGDFVEEQTLTGLIGCIFLLAAFSHALSQLENVPNFRGARAVSLSLFFTAVGVAGIWLGLDVRSTDAVWAVFGTWSVWYGWYSYLDSREPDEQN